MAELVGGPLLSGLYNVLLDRLASKDVIEFFRGNKKAVAELLYELNVRLGSAHKLVNDAEEKQLKDRDVKNWLDGLKEVMEEASHVLDKINTEALERRIEEEDCENSVRRASKLLALSFIPNALFENKVKGDLAEILCKLKTLLDQTGFLGLEERNGAQVLSARLLLPLAPLVEEIDVCGRKAEKEALVKQLLSDDGNDGQKITVIPIVGMGGIGKTTLARIVYNDKEVREHFELKAWVIVSVSFDIPRIAKTILDAVVDGQANIEDPNTLQTNLKNVLRGKRFLFVFDDVWSESYESWDILRSCFESGGRGSKVVVTTRSKIVASVMRNVPDYDLQTISQDDCWNLFAKHVGFHNESNSDMLEIGAKIVKKCKGLPLAVKSIAGLLRSLMCPNEWRRILESDKWESQNTRVIPALWLSYQFLPPHLKRCFAYFSIFPKDYEFTECDKEKIVLLWMAEGLLQEEKGNSRPMEDVGREYINALISRSFFQRSSRNESTLLMHDLLHDLAYYVSGDSSFVLECYNNKDESRKINGKTRHVLYWKTSEDHSIGFEGLSEAKCLRTLLALPLSPSSYLSFPLASRPIEKVLCEVLTEKEQLRVLSLSGNSSLASLGDIFGNLKYLRYLDLSWTKLENLPDSICLLYNLQTLLLSNCCRLTQLPANSCNIINLRHLDVRGTPLKDMPPNIHLLKNLRMLSDFVIGKGDNEKRRTEELGELRLLHGSLMVSGLENIAESSHVSQAGLVEKDLLTELILSWEGETDDSSKEREVLNALRPHAKLKELKVMGFTSTTFPYWVGHQSFSNMVSVSLIKCVNCCLLPPLGQLPSLKSLTIEGMNCVMSIGDEFCGNSSTSKPFPLLENLTIDGMDSLIDWSFSKIDKDIVLFPRLKILNLEFCRKLNFGLPAGCFPSLKGIRIVSCRSMKSVFPNSAQVSVDLAYPSLEAVEVRRCQRMEIFSETGLPRNDNLKRLEIHDDCELLFANRMNWNLPRLSSLKRLELSGCRNIVDSFPEEGLLPSSLERLRIDSFRSLKRLNERGFRHLTRLRQLSIIECKQLKCLPEEGLPTSLSFFCIARCPSLTIRCQRDVGEDWAKIQHIPLIIIDRERI